MRSRLLNELMHVPILYRPYKPVEVRRRLWLIDIPLGINGYLNGKKNLLVFNFWKIIFGLIRDSNVAVKDVTGDIETLVTSGSLAGELCYLPYGTGTKSPELPDYDLESRTGWITTPSVTVGISGMDSVVSVSATIPDTSSELGIIANLKNTSGYVQRILISRIVTTVYADQGVNYKLVFSMPWLYNFALWWYGLLAKADADGVRDTTGASFTLRSTGDAQSGAVSMQIDESEVSFSPDLYALPAPTTINTSLIVDESPDRSYIVIWIVGSYKPTTTMDVKTLGLIQDLYDTNGTLHTTLLFTYPLETPITFDADRLNMVVIRIVAI